MHLKRDRLSVGLQRTARRTLFAATIVFAACTPDVIDKTAPDLTVARESGLLKEGGWLPLFLPSNSKQIRIRYDVDTNEIWVSFVPNGALDPMEKACSQIPRLEARPPRKHPMWWPNALTRFTESEPSDFKVYRCEDRGFAAIKSNAEEAYYWALSEGEIANAKAK